MRPFHSLAIIINLRRRLRIIMLVSGYDFVLGVHSVKLAPSCVKGRHGKEAQSAICWGKQRRLKTLIVVTKLRWQVRQSLSLQVAVSLGEPM